MTPNAFVLPGGDGTIGFDKVKHSDDAKEWRKKFFIGKMEERVS